MEAPRSAERRKSDTLTRLADDVDAWIATADTAGYGYLLPLSFLWDGVGVIVTMIDGTAELVRDEQMMDAFVAKHGWDPRKEPGGYVYFRIVPDRVQAWREVNELPARTLMRDGKWLT